MRARRFACPWEVLGGKNSNDQKGWSGDVVCRSLIFWVIWEGWEIAGVALLLLLLAAMAGQCRWQWYRRPTHTISNSTLPCTLTNAFLSAAPPGFPEEHRIGWEGIFSHNVHAARRQTPFVPSHRHAPLLAWYGMCDAEAPADPKSRLPRLDCTSSSSSCLARSSSPTRLTTREQEQRWSRGPVLLAETTVIVESSAPVSVKTSD